MRPGGRRTRVRQLARSADGQGDEPPDFPPLTSREAQVLTLASYGLTNAEIAADLVLSPSTVKSHLEHIYAKLGASDRASAVAAALRYGVIT